MSWCWGLLAVSLLSAPPAAAGGEPTFRPGYEVSPEVRTRFERLRASARVPTRWNGEGVSKARASEARGLLVAVDDGHVLLRRPLNPAQRAALRRRGTPEVRRKADLRSNVLYQGSYYVLYPAAPGVDLQPLAAHRGRAVRLVLAPGRRGHRVVSATLDR